VGFGLPNAFKVRPQLIFRLCGNFFFCTFREFYSFEIAANW
jgi:hypothetical protein